MLSVKREDEFYSKVVGDLEECFKRAGNCYNILRDERETSFMFKEILNDAERE